MADTPVNPSEALGGASWDLVILVIRGGNVIWCPILFVRMHVSSASLIKPIRIFQVWRPELRAVPYHKDLVM